MVKNTIGGKKGKMISKKSDNTARTQLVLPSDPTYEFIGCVIRVFGGGMFLVQNSSGVEFKAFLRGKMKGSNKRHNLVSLFSLVLCGARIDTDPSKCDILFVYDHNDLHSLSLIPSLNLRPLISMINSGATASNIKNDSNTDDLISFNNSNNLPTTADVPTTNNKKKIEEDVTEEVVEEFDFDAI
jgi:hypothetical protein